MPRPLQILFLLAAGALSATAAPAQTNHFFFGTNTAAERARAFIGSCQHDYARLAARASALDEVLARIGANPSGFADSVRRKFDEHFPTNAPPTDLALYARGAMPAGAMRGFEVRCAARYWREEARVRAWESEFKLERARTGGAAAKASGRRAGGPHPMRSGVDAGLKGQQWETSDEEAAARMAKEKEPEKPAQAEARNPEDYGSIAAPELTGIGPQLGNKAGE